MSGSDSARTPTTCCAVWRAWTRPSPGLRRVDPGPGQGRLRGPHARLAALRPDSSAPSKGPPSGCGPLLPRQEAPGLASRFLEVPDPAVELHFVDSPGDAPDDRAR